MAQSLVNRTFTNTANKNDGVLGDDYVHKNIETWKFKGKTSNNGKWDLKAKISHSQQDGQLSGTFDDELKVVFPFDRYHFQIGTRRSGDLRFHCDFGNITLGGKQYNIFSNLKTNINFKDFQFRVGSNYNGDRLTVSNRIENGFKGCESQGFGLTNRTFFRRGEFFYGLVTSFKLDGFIPTKYDAIVGYEKDQTNLYVEHASDRKVSGFSLGTVTATATFSKDSNSFGAQVANSFSKNSLTSVIGAQTHCSKHNATLKAKISSNLDFEFAAKKKINSQLTVTAAGKLALSKGAQAVDFTKYVPIPFGLQFEVNA